MKNRFAILIDVVFVCFISFALTLVAFNFFTPYPYSLIFSGCASLIATTFYFIYSDKKNKQVRLSKAEQKEKNVLLSELNFSSPQEQVAILERAIKSLGFDYEKKHSSIYIKDKNALLLSRFSFNKINKVEIVKAFNLINKNQTVYVLAQSFDPDIVAFAQRFNQKVRLIDGDKVYTRLKELSALPTQYKYRCFCEKKKKGSIKNLLDKKKAKTFLTFGAFFLAFSYFSPLKIYYIVCGCIFLIYALILRLMGKELKTAEYKT